jgi:hypothetical protein
MNEKLLLGSLDRRDSMEKTHVDGRMVLKSRLEAALYPQEDSWYSFLLEAESTLP